MGKHGPNPRFENYQHVHNKSIRRFVEAGFILCDGLEWSALGDDGILLYGSLECLGSIDIHVWKEIQILEGTGLAAKVVTVDYSYNATLRGVGNILRYDAPHITHRPHHHVHRFDVFASGIELTCEDIFSEDLRPTLGEVVDEVWQWYDRHHDELARLGLSE